MAHEKGFILSFKEFFRLWGIKSREHSEIGDDAEKIALLEFVRRRGATLNRHINKWLLALQPLSACT